MFITHLFRMFLSYGLYILAKSLATTVKMIKNELDLQNREKF
jgi:hypothetical protein